MIGKEARRFRSGLLMLMDAWNRRAVKGLLADTERIVALVDIRDIRGNRELARDTITIARQNYIDLVRRSRPLIMTDDEHQTFQGALDHLKAVLRFFGESV
ncbi:MAG: hypothetical protein WB524_15285 [Acidobacteriaceae bacterium]